MANDEEFLRHFPGLLSIEQLCAKEFQPLEYVVKGLLPVGTALLAGPPKLGKSYFALNLMQMVIEQGHEFYYYAGEDGSRRLQDRIGQLRLVGKGFVQPGREVPLRDAAMQIQRIVEMRPNIKAIFIDTMETVVSQGKTRDYEFWVKEIKPWNLLAEKYSVTIMMIHHTRKPNGIADNSPYDAILGSQGISASFDTLMAMKRADDGNGAVLNITGKDVLDQELRLDKEIYGWSIAGLEKLASLGPTQERVYTYVKENPCCRWTDITEALEIHGGQVSEVLKKLKLKNLINEEVGEFTSLSEEPL